MTSFAKIRIKDSDQIVSNSICARHSSSTTWEEEFSTTDIVNTSYLKNRSEIMGTTIHGIFNLRLSLQRGFIDNRNLNSMQRKII
jgi:hypothetical protein